MKRTWFLSKPVYKVVNVYDNKDGVFKGQAILKCVIPSWTRYNVGYMRSWKKIRAAALKVLSIEAFYTASHSSYGTLIFTRAPFPENVTMQTYHSVNDRVKWAEGETTYPNSFDPSDEDCAPGLHCFLTLADAHGYLHT